MGGEVWHSQQTFTVCTANCWGELRVPSRRRHLHLPLWWLSPVCCLFISGVFAQAVNALGLYSWWKWLGASSRSQCCYSVSPLASHMSRLCSVFHMQQSELYICADFSYYKCQNAFIQIALKPVSQWPAPCSVQSLRTGYSLPPGREALNICPIFIQKKGTAESSTVLLIKRESSLRCNLLKSSATLWMSQFPSLD